SAPQPAPGDSAVALPTTTAFPGIVCAPEPNGDTASRHIPCSTSLRALPCVPSGLVICAGQPEPCPAATGGSGFTIENGSDLVIVPRPAPRRTGLPDSLPFALVRGAGIPARPVPAPTPPHGTDSETAGFPHAGGDSSPSFGSKPCRFREQSLEMTRTVA